jgi:FXSXX-COOH protein
MTDPANADDDFVSELVDLSELPLEVIPDLPPSVLGLALRRVVESARRPDDVQAVGYQKCLT